MAFIPHTADDIARMLDVIGVSGIEDLFDEIPAELRAGALSLPPPLSEMEIARLMGERAAIDGRPLNFIGAGAYEHHIPAPVWSIATRGEFYSAYTPYQAEASQGTLQLVYEYQSMICALTGMEVSNASMYDGASALAEACLMAVRSNRGSSSRRILMPRAVNPTYAQVARAIAGNQDIGFVPVDYDKSAGVTLLEALEPYSGQDFTALVVQQPNFFGSLEEVDALTDWAHENKIILIAVVNPISLALLKPPAEWGAEIAGVQGADIVCGEGQSLGVPLASGGPYFGFMATRMHYVRQMPGRIVGGTVDTEGRPGFSLTLQAREQHIRRSKATSNICTNQGLMVTAATIYMSLLGPRGLEAVAQVSMQRTDELIKSLSQVAGVKRAFTAPHFHEAVLLLDRPTAEVLEALYGKGIIGGLNLSERYPELGNALLVCATETKLSVDIDRYRAALSDAMSASPAEAPRKIS
ncbi:MAG: glycine dehydrogenase subunit 1 [Gammaproteobacteria bacterium]|jgi:glycine dehydrogenase subunit 1|nr:glycine dehydrogenase subunit 1 [Gammaproteobacteria bacterium]MEA3141621.1 glycine dehydrogenase subunit 1 [Gammaproteobacteria bacterium]